MTQSTNFDGPIWVLRAFQLYNKWKNSSTNYPDSQQTNKTSTTPHGFPKFSIIQVIEEHWTVSKPTFANPSLVDQIRQPW
jgi:hypothetical protein